MKHQQFALNIDWDYINNTNKKDCEINDTPTIDDFDHEKKKKIELILDNVYKERVKKYQSVYKNGTFYMNQKLANKGTYADKCSGLNFFLKHSPIYNLWALESLIKMTKLFKRRNDLKTIEIIFNFFVAILPLPDRELVYFYQNPLMKVCSVQNVDKDSLISIHVESRLKSFYLEFISKLKECSKHSDIKVKETVIYYNYKLLCKSPELEKQIFSNVLDKLNDPLTKASSKAAFLLIKFVESNPDCQLIFLNALSRMLANLNTKMYARKRVLKTLLHMSLESVDDDSKQTCLLILFDILQESFFTNGYDSISLFFEAIGYIYNKMENKDLLNNLNEKFKNKLHTIYKICNQNENLDASLKSIDFLVNINKNQDHFSIKLFLFTCKKYNIPYNRIKVENMKLILNITFRLISSDANLIRRRFLSRKIFQSILYMPSNYACLTILFQDQMKTLLSQHFNTSMEMIQLVDMAKFGDESIDTIPLGKYQKYNSCIHSKPWEYVLLKNHYNPTFRLFLNNFIQDKTNNYKSDVINDFSCMRQLERFCSKNPKCKMQKL